jgi:ABC-type Na+ efflux pump permease subunit
MISGRQIRLIAARDFWAIIQTKSFLIGIFVILFVASVMPGMFALSQLKAHYRLAVVDPTHTYAEQITKRLKQPELFELINLPVTPRTLNDVRRQGLAEVRSRKFFGLFEVIPQEDGDEKFTLSMASLADPIPRSILDNYLGDIVQERRAARLKVLPETLSKITGPIDFINLRLTSGAAEKAQDQDFIFAYLLPIGMVFSLYGIISFQSERLLTALLEEKLKKLIEVLLTRATIHELILGKMLGVLTVGFLLYAGVGSIIFASACIFGFSHLLTFKATLFYTLFYIAGYGLYASFYAAIGASCGNPKDAENLSMPLRVILMLPITISVYVNIHPESIGSLFFAYFPLTAPFVMTNRMIVSDVSVAGLCLSLVMVLGAAFCGLWIASRIFRASMMAQGRSLGLRDIWRSLTMPPTRIQPLLNTASFSND